MATETDRARADGTRTRGGATTLTGTIRRRALINAVVDPDEAAHRLPPGLRPHVTALGTVVGCCLLDIDAIRPGWAPAASGVALRAAAHRISVEWEDPEGSTSVGVYVPLRHTDSRIAVAVGGRWFPGVHRRARIRIEATERSLDWTVAPTGAAGFDVHLEARPGPGPCADQGDEPVAATCLAASVGLSPDRRGDLEAARMVPAERTARPLLVERFDSPFVAGFHSARPAPSYLMSEVQVTWTSSYEAPSSSGKRMPACSNAAISAR